MNTERTTETLFMTVAETAHELRVTPRHVYNMMDAGTLKSVKFGRSRRVVTSSIRALAGMQVA